MTRTRTAILFVGAMALGAPAARAQSSSPKPWGRISLFTNTWQTQTDGTPGMAGTTELTTSITYQFPELDEAGPEYGVDLRYSKYATAVRPERVSIYEAFVGGRFKDGALRVRAGNLWLNDLGALGAVAGGLFEVRQPRLLPEYGRFRAGVFGGLEPSPFKAAYAPNVKKAGAYVAYDGDRARRHVVGYIVVRNASLTERSVLTTTNFLPIRQKFFVYQAAEFDVKPPAGQGHSGLAYLFTNARWSATSRLEVQGTYNRGRSIDVRTLSDDVLNGRPIQQSAVNGFLFETIGGRVSVTVIPGVRVYGGYSSDKNSRDARRTARILVGGYGGNVGGSGFDVAASDSRIERPDGSYHSSYMSVGRQIGRRVYLSGDYSTSLSLVRYSRSDGILVELRPHTRRFSGTGTFNFGRAVSLLATAERTIDDDARELRILSGLTYRFR